MKKVIINLSFTVLMLLSFTVTLLAITDRYEIGFNASTSLDDSVYLIDKDKHRGPFNIDDTVVFRFNGESWGFPAQHLWVKKIAGLPGDKLQIKDGVMLINERVVGKINYDKLAARNLNIINIDYIPEDQYFVVGSSIDSFDSRYQEFGLLSQQQIIGLATTLL